MTKEMLINTVHGQECRIAIVENGKLDELYVERVSSASHVGNIYKGRITNVEPSIQAAFVDFGLVKNGFLHISDVNPSFFPRGRRAGSEPVGRKRAHRDRPPIQECLRRGQEVVIQLTKEGIGTKGPTMTTYLSIPGRLLVMMPGMSRLGVSRKIEDNEARDKARKILADLNPPADMGFIVRTAAIDRSKRDFQRDLNYLLRLWKSVNERVGSSKAPAEIYQESDLVTRTIRDVYNADIGRIICDDADVGCKVKAFLDVAMPRTKNVIELYVGREGLFHEYGLEQEIERIYSRRMELASGGSLVFDQTEALVAIDVNSGRFRDHSDAETTATKINIEAAHEIARQLRLRDLGGVIIMDFIDMREERNRRSVEKVLRDEIRNDRAKTKVLKISSFGIVEMTRQRVRPSLKQSIFRTCPHCDGTALIKTEESQALLVMRNLQRACSNDQVAQIEVRVRSSVADHLNNVERRRITEMEAKFSKSIVVHADDSLVGSDIRINCTNGRGGAVVWEEPVRPSHKIDTVSLDEMSLSEPSGEEEEELAEAQQAAREEQTGAQAAEAQTAQESAEVVWPFVEESPETPAPQTTPPAAQAPQPQRPQQAQRPPQQPRPQQSQRAPQAPRAAAAPSGGPPVDPLQGSQVPGKKKRRRGRRGGKRHHKHGQGQQPLPGAPGAQVQPSQPVQPPPQGAVPQASTKPQPQQRQPQRQQQHRAQPKGQAPAGARPQEASAQTQPPPAAPAGGAPPSPPKAGRGRRPRRPHQSANVQQAQAPAAPPAMAAVPQAQGGDQGHSRPSSPAGAGPDQSASQAPATGQKEPVHRQDKEYYEQNIRETKEASRRPKDDIPDEEDQDFSTE